MNHLVRSLECPGRENATLVQHIAACRICLHRSIAHSSSSLPCCPLLVAILSLVLFQQLFDNSLNLPPAPLVYVSLGLDFSNHRAPPPHLHSLPIPLSDDFLLTVLFHSSHTLHQPVQFCLQGLDPILHFLCLSAESAQASRTASRKSIRSFTVLHPRHHPHFFAVLHPRYFAHIFRQKTC